MNNAEAVALRDWLKREGWEDVFLDVDPDRGIAAGERWERALNEAASRCEAVLFLVSRDWLASGWCLREFNLAHKLNKRLFGLLVEDLAVADLPVNLTSTWQLVPLCSGTDHVMLRVSMPFTGKEAHVTFSAAALARLKIGLRRAGLDSRFFAWPPEDDPNRPPYRGLRPLEAEDAGIFFGRDAPIVEALDRLRGLRNGAPPRLLVILGASGAGKSSFLRAGLFPRLARDNQNFLPLQIIRPQQAVISGDAGLLRALEGALSGMGMSRAELRTSIQGGATGLRRLLQTVAEKAAPIAPEFGAKPKPPAIVLSIDQAEELFLAEARDETRSFLALLRDLLIEDAPAAIALFTIRSDNYERLQLAKELEGLRQEMFSLPPMPRGSYAEVIKGPARRLDETARALKIEDGLVDALLADIEAGDSKDALPLLAFTLERLYEEYKAGGHLKVSHYNDLGRVKGSIEAAVERAFRALDADPRIPKDRLARLALLRRGLIPWLAGVDPDTGAPRRRVARLSEIPRETRPLIDQLVEERLLATDVAQQKGESTVEPVHEALLRQWGLLQGWLAEDAGLLGVLGSVKRASRDWAANNKDTGWLIHATGRLDRAERLVHERSDLAANLEPIDSDYLKECRKQEDRLIAQARAAQRRTRLMRAVLGLLFVGMLAGSSFVAWSNQAYLKIRIGVITDMLSPKLLTAVAEQALEAKSIFKECTHCPEMIVVQAGKFTMGSPAGEKGRFNNEGPQHHVVLKSFAVSRFEVTFDLWEACVQLEGCASEPWDQGWEKASRPVINVSWDDAQRYVAWLSKRTGRSYRLLTEAEWEYTARAGSDKAYSWGDEVGKGNANCAGCGSQWDGRQTAPVGSFAANAFGLFDTAGNVWEWVQDCYQDNYNGALVDGSARSSADCTNRVIRGGAWSDYPQLLRSANRSGVSAGFRDSGVGFRVGRTLAR